MNQKQLFMGLALGLSLNVALAHNDGAYSHDSGAVAHNPAWMADVNDATRLSELNLPGTHDTMSIKAGDIWQNQAMTLREQLESGVRVFDMRSRYTGGSDFIMHHGSINQSTKFGADVLQTINDFLTENSSETVVFRLTPTDESDSDSGDKSYATVLGELIDQYGGGRHWDADGEDEDNNPTLAEMRGKFVILDQGISGDWGINYWSQDIQDDYSMGTNWDLYSKWESVKEHMEKSEHGSRDTLYMNYLSASGGSFPYFVSSGHSSPGTSAPRLATGLTTPGWNSSYPDFPRTSCFIGICTISFEGTNILTADYIANGETAFVGMVMADFPGKRLIENIINLNFQSLTGSWVYSGGRSATHDGNVKYSLELTSSASVEINLTSSVDAYLYLLDQTGAVIATNDDGGEGLNSKIVKSLSAGDYTVVSATYSANQVGDFALFTSSSMPGMLKPVDGIAGSWSSSGGRSSTASGNPNYTLTLTEAADVEINLTSTVDTYLYLLDYNGTVVASNDDGGRGYNSKIIKSLAADTYTVVSATYSTAKSGKFMLTTTAGDLTQ